MVAITGIQKSEIWAVVKIGGLDTVAGRKRKIGKREDRAATLSQSGRRALTRGHEEDTVEG